MQTRLKLVGLLLVRRHGCGHGELCATAARLTPIRPVAHDNQLRSRPFEIALALGQLPLSIEKLLLGTRNFTEPLRFLHVIDDRWLK